MNISRLLGVFVGLWIIGLCTEGGGGVLGSPSGSGSTSEAYVTLLYGDEFLLGVRVLGKSIRDTGSTKNMVVLVSDGVSDYSKRLLMVWLKNSFFICVLRLYFHGQDSFHFFV